MKKISEILEQIGKKPKLSQIEVSFKGKLDKKKLNEIKFLLKNAGITDKDKTPFHGISYSYPFTIAFESTSKVLLQIRNLFYDNADKLNVYSIKRKINLEAKK